jgi:uncharacterized protein (DUF488 family)
MLRRQKVLLYLAHLVQQKGIASKTVLGKMLFLLSEKYGFKDLIPFYSFFPYRYGPFSNLFYYDLRQLKERGCLLGNSVTPLGMERAGEVDPGLAEAVEDVVDGFDSEKELVNYVYAKYPEYTVKSELIKHDKKETPPGFFTIGYEGKNIDAFLNILIQNDITVVADVRNNPFSMNFAFTESKLREYLAKVGIRYVHFKQLGIPGEKREKLFVSEDYKKLFEQYSKNILPKNLAHFKRLEEMGGKDRVALLCFEKDVEYCHRGVLAKKLGKDGFAVKHL